MNRMNRTESVGIVFGNIYRTKVTQWEGKKETEKSESSIDRRHSGDVGNTQIDLDRTRGGGGEFGYVSGMEWISSKQGKI